jgi:hypothetical protein
MDKRIYWIKCLLVTVISLLLLPPFSQGQTWNEKDWKSLFNGKNLTNWTVKIRNHPAGENFAQTFQVKKGKIVVGYAGYGEFNERFGHLFYNKPYSYYRIRLEYRFTGDQCKGGPDWAYRNSGIMVHGQTPESMGKDQDFPVSIEVQLLGGNGKDPRSTCNLCTPGTHVVMNGKLFTPHCVNSRSATYHGDQWVKAEVLVLGDSVIRHYVNGQEVLSYEKPQVGGGNVDGEEIKYGATGMLLSSGTISLQSESHPVEFRKIELLDLEGCMDPKAKNYRSYYIRSKSADCRY